MKHSPSGAKPNLSQGHLVAAPHKEWEGNWLMALPRIGKTKLIARLFGERAEDGTTSAARLHPSCRPGREAWARVGRDTYVSGIHEAPSIPVLAVSYLINSLQLWANSVTILIATVQVTVLIGPDCYRRTTR